MNAKRWTKHTPTLGAAMLIPVWLWSLTMGAIEIAPKDAVVAVWDKLTGRPARRPAAEIVTEIRMPRVAMATLTGAALALSGAALQGLFRNPLAEPSLIGVSSGATLGAVFFIVYLEDWIRAQCPTWALKFALPTTAFIFALAVTHAVMRLSSRKGQTSIVALLLTGVAANAWIGAMVGLMFYLGTDAQIRAITFWTLGGLSGSNWWNVGILTAFMTIALAVYASRLSSALNVLSLGEAEAQHLGMDVEKIKRRTVTMAALAVGASTAFTGLIGFVGLIIPQMLRLWLGPDHKTLLPAAALYGALFLPLADAAARTMAAPAELPLGILTAAIGAPVFLILLRKNIHEG
ncbi:MAG: iron ABC transporter permease [Bacteroidia bacterium]|nr:iron ABC transporter permease [Bacteroidia bacterium]MDW8334013.1 iron ABC transporter permease [Bacteroidia bacterium]